MHPGSACLPRLPPTLPPTRRGVASGPRVPWVNFPEGGGPGPGVGGTPGVESPRGDPTKILGRGDRRAPGAPKQQSIDENQQQLEAQRQASHSVNQRDAGLMDGMSPNAIEGMSMCGRTGSVTSIDGDRPAGAEPNSVMPDSLQKI